jgi:hypothetical protein
MAVGLRGDDEDNATHERNETEQQVATRSKYKYQGVTMGGLGKEQVGRKGHVENGAETMLYIRVLSSVERAQGLS